jgi:hypothetical protein
MPAASRDRHRNAPVRLILRSVEPCRAAGFSPRYRGPSQARFPLPPVGGDPTRDGANVDSEDAGDGQASPTLKPLWRSGGSHGKVAVEFSCGFVRSGRIELAGCAPVICVRARKFQRLSACPATWPARFCPTNRGVVNTGGSWRVWPSPGSSPPASHPGSPTAGFPSAKTRTAPRHSGGGTPHGRSAGYAAGPCGSGSRP